MGSTHQPGGFKVSLGYGLSDFHQLRRVG
jgi:hypothetical protein